MFNSYIAYSIFQAFSVTIVSYKNIKENNLSMKALNEKLEKLTSSIDDKNSTSTSVVNKLPLMTIVSALLLYGKNLPIVSKAMPFLERWYGKTSWWQLMAIARKAFLTFNALIGVLAVFKLTGFSSDNVIGGFYGVGAYYMEMLGSLVRRIFNFFFDFFDYRLVPNTPSEVTRSTFNKFNPLPIDFTPKPFNPAQDIDSFSLRKLYTQQPVNINVNTGWGFNSWWWYVGAGAGALALLYLGMKIYVDPTTVTNYLPGRTPERDIFKVLTGGIASLYSGLTHINLSTLKYLNPFYYFSGTSSNRSIEYVATFEDFLATQKKFDSNLRDEKYFPYTPVNPYDNWYTSIRKKIFGEYPIETLERENIAKSAASSYGKIIKTASGKFIPIPIDPSSSRLPGSTFLGTGTDRFEADNTPLSAIHSVHNASRLSTIPPTPIDMPTLPNVWTETGINAEKLSGSLEVLTKISEHGSPKAASPALSLDSIAGAAKEVTEELKGNATSSNQLAGPAKIDIVQTGKEPILEGATSDVKGKGVAKPDAGADLENEWKEVKKSSSKHK